MGPTAKKYVSVIPACRPWRVPLVRQARLALTNAVDVYRRNIPDATSSRRSSRIRIRPRDDGRIKTEFSTKEGAERGALELKRRFPLLWIRVFDAAAGAARISALGPVLRRASRLGTCPVRYVCSNLPIAGQVRDQVKIGNRSTTIHEDR